MRKMYIYLTCGNNFNSKSTANAYLIERPLAPKMHLYLGIGGKMKHLLLALFATMATTAMADTYVQGYYKSNGTYVQPHFRSNADSTTLNNYSTRGNINPYNGNVGTANPYPTQQQNLQPTGWQQYQQQNKMWGN